MLPLLLPILAHALTVTVGDTTEAHYRSDDTGPHFDLITTGRMALNLGLSRANWTLFYSPSVTQLGLGSADSSLILYNAGGLNLNLRLSPLTTISFSELAGYGTQNIRALAVAAPQPNAATTTVQPGTTGAGQDSPNLGAAPPAVLATRNNATIGYGTLSSVIGITRVLDQRWATRWSAGYSISGGVDSLSETAMPRIRTYSSSLSLSRLMSPRDQAVSLASTSYTLTEPNAEAVLATLSVGWIHRFSTRSNVSFMGGEAYATSTAIDGSHSTEFFPVASIVLTTSKARSFAGGRLSAMVASSVSPVVDRFSGSAVPMLTNTVSSNWNRRRLSLQIAGMGASAIGHQRQSVITTNYALSESVSYQLDRRHWTVTAGSRQALQRFADSQRLPLFWTTFISLTYTTGTGPF